ncbi:MAG: ABC transporter substrate-binding protein [Fimbriimonadaceae bacterium]|nr:ABC transporter substrate-binding protein [Fimbriimonadaceae bacterium]
MKFNAIWKPTLGVMALSIAAFGVIGCNGKTADNGGSTTPDGGTASAAKRPAPTGAGNTDSGSGPIKVGLVASLNGELKPWGADSQAGALLALEEFNAAGGVDGRMVDLMIEDSNSKPEQGKTAAEKLMSNGALAVIGEVSSGITAQMAQATFEKGVPLVAVGATRTDVTDIGANVFRVCYIDDFQGPVMAKFAYEALGKRRVGIMTDIKQPYSTYLSKSFAAYFKKLGGEVVAEENYESQQTQFSSQLKALKDKNPDCLFLSGYFTEVGPIIRQASEQGIDVPYVGGDGWDSREIITNAGAAIKNGYFCNHYNNDEDREEVKAFLAAWKKKYNSTPATTMGALGYDATMLVLQSLKTAAATGTLDSKSLMAAIDNTENFPGVSGSITLKGKNGNPEKRALVVGLDPVSEKQVFKKAYDYFEPK